MTINFNAGPAGIAAQVLEKAQAELLNYAGSGISIMEASHRGDDFQAVIDAAEAGLRRLINIPDDYEVLFLQGGASTQFAMIPMNLRPDGSADYIDSGAWSSKAIKEAKILGQGTEVIASSKDANYNYIPADFTVNPDAKYLHVTSNNTIFGTQFAAYPDSGDVPLIADMSSDIMSREIDVSKFGMIYAGAQKNMGPSGITLVILRKDLAERAPDNLPSMLNYTTHIAAGSMYNTPPTFAIYLIKLVCEWVESLGGIAAIEKMNNEKAALLYSEIDSDDFYTGSAQEGSRSKMNVCFNLANEELEAAFIKEATELVMIGLKGHRSVGGIRASIYNAMPIEGVEELVDFMKIFREKN
ncbi:MAG: 3-phosphoserine/phosphohydroxythreonine transaminase [Lentisphaeria bacterium]|nr:3-phosphoserine/phosphohydroxythreonine transaminase [Lentisphaeria bacterium]NQZ70869.1 3-phosphoserine/phosphohydroxythreonine transaminase [Lentisphaeria bacterium]